MVDSSSFQSIGSDRLKMLLDFVAGCCLNTALEIN